ncbi:MAG TPA: PfkB family carbohydrate kinase [Acidobacteriota bacterium]|nr:PfkB family carbohydrate kinase [Acidobacteriota bacterium]
MRKHLLKVLDQFSSRKILVIGDLIADEFLYGRIARISREAPVLVLEYRDPVRVPGGAANAANNLLDLGCGVAVAGAVGQDAPGKDLLAILRGKGADVRAIRRLRSLGTPVKTRILAGAPHSAPQQIVRVDRVHTPGSFRGLPLKALEQSIRASDAIILSDYGYGNVVPALLPRLVQVASAKGVPLVVDSRFRMSEFPGVTSITPNITELEAAVGMSIGNDAALLQEVGQKVVRDQRLQSLLVTQGKFGMTLFERDKAALHIPIYGTDEIADVTGAGDTVIAIFTLALACGAATEQAARLANYGGGIVVMKRGTATVSRDELRVAIQNDP